MKAPAAPEGVRMRTGQIRAPNSNQADPFCQFIGQYVLVFRTVDGDLNQMQPTFGKAVFKKRCKIRSHRPRDLRVRPI